MKLGIYLDLRNPPGRRRDRSRRYGETLELCQEAERLGAESIRLSEHHRFEDGYLPQPLTFAAAVAARTSRVRIGTAVLPAALRDPVSIAEEAAIVDLLSAVPGPGAAGALPRRAGSPVEHVFFWASLAGMPTDRVHRHVELLCTELAPC